MRSCVRMKSFVSVCVFVWLGTVHGLSTWGDVVLPTVSYSSTNSGITPTAVDDFYYGQRGVEFQAFLEFKIDQPVDRAILEFISRDHFPAKILPTESFSIFVYEANGQADPDDWNRGSYEVILYNSGNETTHHAIDFTDAYQKFQANGIEYIGFRFTNVSLSDLLVLSDAQMTISSVPEPAPVLAIPVIAWMLFRRRRSPCRPV